MDIPHFPMFIMAMAGYTHAGCYDPPEPFVDWSGCDKRGAALAGIDLHNANLEHTNLQDADLSGANLRGAYMYSTYLWGANLRGANLQGASTLGAYLRESQLDKAVWADGRICGPGSTGGCY